ncbi:hypothetical protein V2J09_020796, partial [Rumex salicifolius]
REINNVKNEKEYSPSKDLYNGGNHLCAKRRAKLTITTFHFFHGHNHTDCGGCGISLVFRMKAFQLVIRSLFSGSPSTFNSGNRCLWIARRAFSGDCKFDGETKTLPVLIVGAGPVGLVLSMLLTKLGVKCAILEKGKAFSRHPQAHFINNRTMEVFRKLDGLAQEIERSQPPVDLWRKFVYCISLSGSILGSVDHIQPQDLDQVVSPVSVAHFSQLLLERVEKLGFHVRNKADLSPVGEKEILMGHELVSIHASDHCVNVTASFQMEGKYYEKNIQCGILVGADGAASTVRRLIGVNMVGETDLQKLVSVHFLSKDLGIYLSKERPGMLFFIFNTEAIGVLVAHDLRQGEFVLQVPYYPPQQSLEDFKPAMCKNLIFNLVGRELEDVDVLDVKPWVMHAEVAEKYLTPDNRVILVGDASHRFPPAGGFGMNTGIQDAHNLAWKLASVINNIAPLKLLKTYETERRPIATYNTQLSVENFKAAMAVPAALGLDPTVANTVHRVISDGLGSILPSKLQRLILDGVFSIGRSQVADAILNEKNPVGSARLTKLKHIFEQGKSLQLQFPAEDLGFRYVQGAIAHGSDQTHATPPKPPTGRRRGYIPCVEPGSRLPHMKMRVLSGKETMSSLDLVSVDKVDFALIVGPVKESYDLACAAVEVADRFKLHLKVCVVWPAGDDGRQDDDGGLGRASLPPCNIVDIVEDKGIPSSWWDICKMSNKGAILVRPDEHVAWCSKSHVSGDHYSEMEKVFSHILCLDSANVTIV